MATHLGPGNAIRPIHFFKIILKTNVERLKIPSKFTRRYGGGLSNPVFIKPPDDTEWKVYWTKQNGEVWFEKGWKEFVENYSLDHGYLVFFKYEGTSQFDVLILDQTAVEIDYPSRVPCDEQDIHDQSDDESVKILGEIPPDKKARPKSPSFSDRSYKKMRNDAEGNVERSSHLQKLHAGDQSDEWTEFQKSIQQQPNGANDTERTSSLNFPRRVRAQEIAKNFISCNPFFTVFIKPVNLREYCLTIPDLEGYIENKVKYVTLQLGKSTRSWHVKLLRYTPSSRRLGSGWSLFASESELQPGDVCVFELINRQDSVFMVHVFKSHS